MSIRAFAMKVSLRPAADELVELILVVRKANNPAVLALVNRILTRLPKLVRRLSETIMAGTAFFKRTKIIVGRRVLRVTALSVVASIFVTALVTGLFILSEGGRAFSSSSVFLFALFMGTLAPLIVCPLVSIQLAVAHHKLLELKDELHKAAATDHLTGLLNRRGFHLEAEAVLEATRGTRRSISILMCDIDRFKLVNDRFGHDFGDLVLVNVADAICQSLAQRRFIVSRRGGEEFAILLADCTQSQALEEAEAVRAAVAMATVLSQDGDYRATVSVGAASGQGDDVDLNELLSRADQALYEAKRRGRNRAVLAYAAARRNRAA